MKMPTIFQWGRVVVLPIVAIAVSCVGCTGYELARLELDAGVVQPTLVTPSTKTEGFRSVAWISKPTERSRWGYLSYNGHESGPTMDDIDTTGGAGNRFKNPGEWTGAPARNTTWLLPDLQGGGYIELQLPQRTYFGIGGQFSIRHGTTAGLLEGRIGITEESSHFMTRSSFGGFIGKLRVDAIHLAESGYSGYVSLYETSGWKMTDGFFAEGVFGGIPSQERIVPFLAIAIVRQRLFTHTLGTNNSGISVELDEIMWLHSVTPGVDIPLSNGSKLTVAVRIISDASLSYTIPNFFFMPLVQLTSEF